ncbi:hypothetical protein ACPEEZ_13805 [Frigoribacterium sp. 2-23]|uniref:hypothetical protein n=1 Tax=Frigoribacterium sp. 2-23 TaxID=3415006 RepID=UPI003C6ECCF7
MRLHLDSVGIGDGPGADLPPISVTADHHRPGFVAVETENAPTLASLVAGGRMSPDHGRVTIDGREESDVIRASFALVDTPTVAEPFPSMRVRQVVREELALAGRRADARSAREFIDRIGLAEHTQTRLQALPTEARTRLLCELALQRDGVRGLVLTSPERHGGDVLGWLDVVHDLVRRDVTVLVVTSLATATTIDELTMPDYGREAGGDADDDKTETAPITTTLTPSDDTAVAPTPESDRL